MKEFPGLKMTKDKYTIEKCKLIDYKLNYLMLKKNGKWFGLTGDMKKDIFRDTKQGRIEIQKLCDKLNNGNKFSL